MLNLFF